MILYMITASKLDDLINLRLVNLVSKAIVIKLIHKRERRLC